MEDEKHNVFPFEANLRDTFDFSYWMLKAVTERLKEEGYTRRWKERCLGTFTASVGKATRDTQLYDFQLLLMSFPWKDVAATTPGFLYCLSSRANVLEILRSKNLMGKDRNFTRITWKQRPRCWLAWKGLFPVYTEIVCEVFLKCQKYRDAAFTSAPAQKTLEAYVVYIQKSINWGKWNVWGQRSPIHHVMSSMCPAWLEIGWFSLTGE